MKFSLTLEQATVEAMEQGHLTKDLAILVHQKWDVVENTHYLRTEKFMERIDEIF